MEQLMYNEVEKQRSYESAFTYMYAYLIDEIK